MRVVQPEFYDHPVLGGLSWDARLVFIASWSYVRDEGVGLDSVARLAGTMFAEDVERDYEGTTRRIRSALDELTAAGMLVRFEHDQVKYIEVAEWHRWQKPDKPGRRRYPSSDSFPVADSRESPEGLANDSRVIREDLTDKADLTDPHAAAGNPRDSRGDSANDSRTSRDIPPRGVRKSEYGSRSSEAGVWNSDVGVRGVGAHDDEPLDVETSTLEAPQAEPADDDNTIRLAAADHPCDECNAPALPGKDVCFNHLTQIGVA